MKLIYHHRTRGTDAQLVHILQMIYAFREVGHQVELVSLVDIENTPQDPERDAGEAWWKKVVRRIPFAYEAVQLAYNLVGVPMLLRRALVLQPDFLYERYSMFNFTGVIVSKLLRIPLVLEVNSPFSIEMTRDKDIRATGFAIWTERVICNAATRVIVVSMPLKRILVKLGVAEERLAVMQNGVNLQHFRVTGETAPLRTRLGLMNVIAIGFIGWFRNWHGLGMLLETYCREELWKYGAKLLLIGDGPAMGELRQYVSDHQLQDKVVFTGPLAHEEMNRYAELIDIAVQPAANEYCCPMKILEYMAMGKPTVGPRQENICELIDDGKEGLLFQPENAKELGQALLRLVQDEPLRREMGVRAGRAIHEKGLLWTRNAERVVQMVKPGAPVQGEVLRPKGANAG